MEETGIEHTETCAAIELPDDNVELIRLDHKIIFLVGTAHISKKSAELVSDVIEQVRPDSVAVELCHSRYQSLKDPDRWKNMDIVSVIREGRAYVLVAHLLLASFQKKLGDQLDIKPGIEMLKAVEAAEKAGAETVLADRDVRITLKRIWASLDIWSMSKLIATMLGATISDTKIDEAEIERLKSADALEEAMREFSESLPKVRTALIDERDKYLAKKIHDAPGDTVVAVVGAGHVPGIKKWIREDIDLSELEVVPPPGILSKVLAWIIPLLVIGMIVYGFIASGANTSYEMIKAWVWINSSLAAIGAVIALAHPLTIIAAFIASPITSLNPFIGVGWVAGLVEAFLRKPRVGDFETVADDIASVKGIWKNRLSRILLVFVLTSILGAIGTFIGAGRVAALL